MGPGGLRLLIALVLAAGGGDAVQSGGQQQAEPRHREPSKLMRSEAEEASEDSRAQAHVRSGVSSEGDPAPAPAPDAPKAPDATQGAGGDAGPTAECAPCKDVKSLIGEKANPTIPDKNIEASTTWQNDPDHGYGQMWRVRLDNDDTTWCAGSNDAHQWLKFTLAKKSLITAIVTKGRANCCDQWVTKYDLFADEKPQGSFEGNKDGKSEVLNKFDTPFVAQDVKLVPTAWSNHISMRVELLGCDCVKPTTTTKTTTTAKPTTTAAPKSSARPLHPGGLLTISVGLLLAVSLC